MRLYYSPGSIAAAVAITLHEAGLDFEPCRVDFKLMEQTKPEYLAVNSKGRVPTLEVGGERLTETGAILDYIASLAPQANLVPDDPLKAAYMRSVMYFLASTMHVNHAHKARGSRWADRPESLADMTAKVPALMAQNAAYVEAECLRGEFVVGDQFTLADPYLFVVCGWLEGDGVSLVRFPLISDYLQRMRTRTSVQKAISDGILPS